jgi:hypothetical protein
LSIGLELLLVVKLVACGLVGKIRMDEPIALQEFGLVSGQG